MTMTRKPTRKLICSNAEPRHEQAAIAERFISRPVSWRQTL
jgi:hypothetical protein